MSDDIETHQLLGATLDERIGDALADLVKCGRRVGGIDDVHVVTTTDDNGEITVEVTPK